jgi:23S rRNA (uracil1939-C5)-methyltransferase
VLLPFRIQTVQLTIDKLIYGGDGLARLSADERGHGKSVFVPFVLEGERIEAALNEQKSGFARAQMDKVLEPSPARVAPQCPYFQSCGGCHYQHSEYQHQLEIKSAILRETLQRTGKIKLPCELRVHPSPPWNYRNRARLKVQTPPEFALGYYRFRSHDFLAVDSCPISSPLINRAIRDITAFAGKEKIDIELREMELFANHADDALLIEVFCARDTHRRDARQLSENLRGAMQEVAGVVVFEQASPQSEPKLLAHCGETHLTYETKLAAYRVSAGSFFQVNRFVIDELVEIVTAAASGEVALDLYAGAGLFSLVLARNFAQVIAVESSQTSYGDLRHNAQQEVKAVRATTERYLEDTPVRADFVVVDPPRGGLGERNVRNLVLLRPSRITYVSCDPSTLARDLRDFVSLGYRIEGADLIDLFPQTYHIESVIRLAL